MAVSRRGAGVAIMAAPGASRAAGLRGRRLADIDFEEIAKRVVNDGGASVDCRRGRRLVRGFMVSIPRAEVRVPGMPTAADIAAYVAVHEWLLRCRGAYLGAWYNRADGHTYFDVSRRQRKLSHALKKGAKWNQQAVYDLGCCREIPVGPARPG